MPVGTYSLALLYVASSNVLLAIANASPALLYTDFRPEQPANDCWAMLVTSFSIYTSFTELKPLNHVPTLLQWNVTEASFEHPEKAEVSMLVTLLGMVTEYRDEQL